MKAKFKISEKVRHISHKNKPYSYIEEVWFDGEKFRYLITHSRFIWSVSEDELFPVNIKS